MSNRLKLLREKATRPRRTVPVQTDGEVREQIEAVEDALDRLDSAPEDDRRQNSRSAAAQRKDLAAEVAALRESAADTTVYAVLEAMQRTAFRALLGQYPPRTSEDGKVIVADRYLGANILALAAPLAKACLIGYKERPDADAPMLPFDQSTHDEHGAVKEPGFVDWLLGYTRTDPATCTCSGEGACETAKPEDVPGFGTERQIDTLCAAALALCAGDDAVPLPRRRSPTTTRAEG